MDVMPSVNMEDVKPAIDLSPTNPHDGHPSTSPSNGDGPGGDVDSNAGRSSTAFDPASQSYKLKSMKVDISLTCLVFILVAPLPRFVDVRLPLHQLGRTPRNGGHS